MRCPILGTPGFTMTLATGAGLTAPYDVTVDATRVYWTDQMTGAVMSVPKVGGTAVTLATGKEALGLATDGEKPYWVDRGWVRCSRCRSREVRDDPGVGPGRSR